MHDHAGLVFEPQIACAGRLQAGLARTLRIGPGKLRDIIKFVDVARDVDLGDAAGPDYGADELEWISLAPEGEHAFADPRTADEKLVQRDSTGRWQTRNALCGRHCRRNG